MSRDDPRGVSPMSEEDALDAALAEAMPMIVFWHDAERQFGVQCKEALIEHFDNDLWDIIRQYADREDVRLEIFDEIKNYKIEDLAAAMCLLRARNLLAAEYTKANCHFQAFRAKSGYYDKDSKMLAVVAALQNNSFCTKDPTE